MTYYLIQLINEVTDDSAFDGFQEQHSSPELMSYKLRVFLLLFSGVDLSFQMFCLSPIIRFLNQR